MTPSTRLLRRASLAMVSRLHKHNADSSILAREFGKQSQQIHCQRNHMITGPHGWVFLPRVRYPKDPQANTLDAAIAPRLKESASSNERSSERNIRNSHGVCIHAQSGCDWPLIHRGPHHVIHLLRYISCHPPLFLRNEQSCDAPHHHIVP